MSRTLRSVAAFVLLVGPLSACSKDPDVAKREYVQSGDRFVADGKLNEAVVQYRNALQHDPKYAEARYKLAETYVKLKDIPNAYREYVRAADLDPNNMDAQLKAAAFLMLGQQFEDAKTRARKVLVKEPRNVQALLVLGSSLAGLKDYKSSLEQLERAVSLEASVAGYEGLASVHLATGALPEAESAFRKAVETEPKSAPANMALAQFLLATGRVEEAQRSFQAALDANPDDEYANRGLATFYISTGKAALAGPLFRRLADVDKSPDARARLVYADYLVATGHPGDALKLLETIALVPGAYGEARARTATVNYLEGRTTEARKMIDEAIAKAPRDVAPQLAKVRFQLAEHQLEAALAGVKQAIELKPDSLDARLLLARTYQALGRSDDAITAYNDLLRLNPLAREAQEQLPRLLLAKGSTASSLEFAEAALKRSPGNPDAALAVARAAVANRQLDRARAAAASLSKQYPQAASVRALQGTIAYASGDKAAARRAFEGALEKDRLNVEALNGLLQLDADQGRVAEAVKRIEAALSNAQTNVPVLLVAARTFSTAKQYDKAEQAARKVIERDPNSLLGYSFLGQIYVITDKLDLARSEFERMVERQPRSVAAHTMVATVYELQKNAAAARKKYEHILTIDPQAAVAANNLAYMYAESGGNLDVALQLAQTAKQQLPDSLEVDDTLGWVYYKRSLPSMAVQALRRCVDREPSNAVYQLHYGLAQAKNGDKAEARKALSRAVAEAPDAPGAAEARQVLARL